MSANWELIDYLHTLPESEREDVVYRFEERAGICEDSGATREQAEQMAMEEVMR